MVSSDRFIAERLAGLGDEPRPGAPREIGDEKIEQVVRLTLEKTPKGATHWSSRMLAVRTGLSQSTISPHLACLWTEAASHRELSAID